MVTLTSNNRGWRYTGTLSRARAHTHTLTHSCLYTKQHKDKNLGQWD